MHVESHVECLCYQICGGAVSAWFLNIFEIYIWNIYLKLHLFSQSKDPYKRGVDYFYKEIRKLSYPYSQKIENYDNFEKFLEFQNFLDIYDTKDTEVFYNTRDRMKKVSKFLSNLCKYISRSF